MRTLVSELEETRSALVRLDAASADQVMVWGSVWSALAARFPDLRVEPLHLRPATDSSDASAAGLSEYRLSRGRGADPRPEGGEVRLDLAAPEERDLVAVMYGRRRAMCRHHGLLVTRGAQRRAFERAVRLGVSSGARLCRAFEILDGAVLAHRQRLLSLAASRADVERIERALGAIALVIDEVLGRSDASGGGEPPRSVRPALRLAVRAFQADVDALGGPARAVFIREATVDDYANVAL